MNACVNVFLLLRFGWSLLQHAAKRRLNMTAWTAEAIIKIEMAKSGIEIVGVKTADDVSAHPYAFRVTGRTAELLRHFQQLVDPRCFLLLIALLLFGLVALIRIVLRQSRPGGEHNGQAEGR